MPLEEQYRLALMLWKIELQRETPAWADLQNLHRRLCELEIQLRSPRAEERLGHLYERMRAAGALGLELQLPEWASLEDLDRMNEGEGEDDQDEEAA
jgi:hypothetical protein